MDRRAQFDAIAAIQSRQLGLITAQQARAAGVASDVLHQEVRAGRWRRVRTGVFAVVGAPVSYQQELLGVVLAAAGIDGLAAGSHATAAYELCLPLPSRDRPPFEVTTPLDRKPVIRGVRLHRSGHLTARDITHVGAISVTTASRTIVDLSMRLDGVALGRALDEALRRRLLTLGQLQGDALRLRVAPGRSMHRVLALVMARTGEDASESDLEVFAIDALKRFGVRLPTQQHPVQARGGRKRRVDLCYFIEKMAIEALGYEYHGLRTRFDEDAVRNNELVRAGYTPLFVTSAMKDWEVAALIAEAIGDDVPARPVREFTFADWKKRRYR